ncbi:hypothetical protein Tco_0212680 [Tanacetum coccineum]
MDICCSGECVCTMVLLGQPVGGGVNVRRKLFRPVFVDSFLGQWTRGDRVTTFVLGLWKITPSLFPANHQHLPRRVKPCIYPPVRNFYNAAGKGDGDALDISTLFGMGVVLLLGTFPLADRVGNVQEKKGNKNVQETTLHLWKSVCYCPQPTALPLLVPGSSMVVDSGLFKAYERVMCSTIENTSFESLWEPFGFGKTTLKLLQLSVDLFTYGRSSLFVMYIMLMVLVQISVSVGNLSMEDLEVGFSSSNTCYVRNMEEDDLLTGVALLQQSHGPMASERLSHLNFGTINDLTKLELVDGLPKFKYGKYHLCSACERGKSKKASHPPKLILSDYRILGINFYWICLLVQWSSSWVNGKKY